MRNGPTGGAGLRARTRGAWKLDDENAALRDGQRTNAAPVRLHCLFGDGQTEANRSDPCHVGRRAEITHPPLRSASPALVLNLEIILDSSRRPRMRLGQWFLG
jgi:hypothetical protein